MREQYEGGGRGRRVREEVEGGGRGTRLRKEYEGVGLGRRMKKQDERGEEKMYKLAVIHWKISGKTGHGQPIAIDAARACVEEMNNKYGAGTHWLEHYA